MEIIQYPEKNIWNDILKRPAFSVKELETNVSNILEDVKANGDAAIKKYALQFDKVSLNTSIFINEKYFWM